MKEIKTLLPEELIGSLEAKEKGIHRSELIRERLSQPPIAQGSQPVIFIKLLRRCVVGPAMVWIGSRLKALSPLSSTNSSAQEMATRSVNLQYCQISDEHCPLAITRFTSFDLDNKPLSVEQVTYESNMDYMERQVISALSCNVEVSILTATPFMSSKDFITCLTRTNERANLSS